MSSEIANSVLHVRTGTLTKPEAIRHFCKEMTPELSWFEPTVQLPKRGAQPFAADFSGIRAGLPDFSRGLPQEVRLCWRDACLHIVVVPEFCRWAAFATREAALPHSARSGDSKDQHGLYERARKIVWRQDLARFSGPALEPTVPTMDAEVREFHQGARIVAWWLVKPTAANAQDQ